MNPLPSLTHRLAEEHLEELSFLLLDRVGSLSQPDGIARAAEAEARIDAHLDGLRFAGEPALEHLSRSLVGRDLELVQGASYALASLESMPGALEAALAGLVTAKDEAIPAHRDALRHALHPELGRRLVPLLAHPRARVREAAVDVLAHRGEVEARALVLLLEDADAGVRRAGARAIAAHGGPGERARLEAALLADALPESMGLLLRMGSSAALASLRALVDRGEALPGHVEALALAGGAGDLKLLSVPIALPQVRSAAAEALGIHGHPECVRALIGLLADQEESARVAAGRGFEILTAAGLTETFEVPEEESAEAEEPARTVQVSRASTDAAAWRDWFGRHRDDFQPGIRVRAGKPFSLGQLITDLEAPGRDLAARRRALLELEIRSGQRFAYEPDDFATRRARGLAAWRAWWKANEAKFPPGGWTFAGAPIS